MFEFRCMEHSIDLSACHFIQDVSPSSTQKLLKKIKAAFHDTDVGDIDTLSAHLSVFDFENAEDAEEDDDDSEVDGAQE